MKIKKKIVKMLFLRNRKLKLGILTLVHVTALEVILQRPGGGLITHWSRIKMAEKVNKLYTCCQYDFDISLHLVYL